MKRILTLSICLACWLCSFDRAARGDCTPRTISGPTLQDGTSQGCGWDPGADGAPNFPSLVKIESRTIAWPDGYKMDVTASSSGECRLYYPNCHINFELDTCAPKKWHDPISFCYRQYFECWPEFLPPQYSSNGNYHQAIFRDSGSVTQEVCSRIIGDDKDTVACVRGAPDDSIDRNHTCPKTCD